MNFNGEMGKAKRYGVLYRVVCGVGGGYWPELRDAQLLLNNQLPIKTPITNLTVIRMTLK